MAWWAKIQKKDYKKKAKVNLDVGMPFSFRGGQGDIGELLKKMKPSISLF
jgi:hypothetical protein